MKPMNPVAAALFALVFSSIRPANAAAVFSPMAECANLMTVYDINDIGTNGGAANFLLTDPLLATSAEADSFVIPSASEKALLIVSGGEVRIAEYKSLEGQLPPSDWAWPDRRKDFAIEMKDGSTQCLEYESYGEPVTSFVPEYLKFGFRSLIGGPTCTTSVKVSFNALPNKDQAGAKNKVAGAMLGILSNAVDRLCTDDTKKNAPNSRYHQYSHHYIFQVLTEKKCSFLPPDQRMAIAQRLAGCYPELKPSSPAKAKKSS